jgi:cell filamentation protein
VSYASGSDPLCYPDSTVLRNKAGIQNQAQLDAFELEMVLSRSTEPWPSGQVDAAHYLSLHHYLFQDVYDWAGTIRSIRIGKDGSWFCYPEHIAGEMEKLFNWLAAERQFQSLRGVDFASKAARFLSELNAIHPFREGNGRTQMSFLILLAERAGLPFNIAALDPKRAMRAMIDSFTGRIEPLEMLIRDLVLQR